MPRYQEGTVFLYFSELINSKQRVKLDCDPVVQRDMSLLLVSTAATPTPINLPHSRAT